MEDRLDKLLKYRTVGTVGTVGTRKESTDPFIVEFFQQIDELRGELDQTRNIIKELKDKYNISVEQVTSKSRKKTLREIEDSCVKIKALSLRIRTKLEMGSKYLPESDKDGLTTHQRIMVNTHRSLTKDFLDIMQEYEELRNSYNKTSRDIVKSSILVSNPELTDEQVEKVIQLDPDQMMALNRKENAKEAYSYIQDRHNEILKIEKSLEEVHQMFIDMAVLIKEESETVERVSYQVQNAKRDISIGNDEIRGANQIQRHRCSIQ